MDEDEISYKNLRKIQQMEKNSPVLTGLKSGFYNELFEYLEKLDKRLEKESSSQKQILLKDEIQNTRKIVANVYEQREKKILLAAVSKARSGNPDRKNMLDVEKNLFDAVLGLLLQSREWFLENKTKKYENVTNSEKTESKKENIVEEKQENSNPVLLVTKGIPEFIGTDTKRYNLRKDDVVSMPENMSDMLLKRNVAEKIKW